jgi:hypothetical protein
VFLDELVAPNAFETGGWGVRFHVGHRLTLASTWGSHHD